MPSFDLKKYSGQRFIKPEHVREHPQRDTIVGVKEGKFGKLELLLESGDILSLNATNTEVLMNAYGRNSDRLVAKEIEDVLRPAAIQRQRGSDHDAVLVKPISPPDKIDFNDEIPF